MGGVKSSWCYAAIKDNYGRHGGFFECLNSFDCKINPLVSTPVVVR